MKFEIRNVKQSEFASHETNCFQAVIYVDGKKAFGVENDGWGGPDSYFAVPGGVPRPQVWERVKEIDAELGKERVAVDDSGKIMTPNCLEIVVGDLLNAWLREKDARKILKKIAYLNGGVVYALPAKHKPTPENLAAVKRAKWWKPEYVMLNELPFEDAVKAMF